MKRYKNYMNMNKKLWPGTHISHTKILQTTLARPMPHLFSFLFFLLNLMHNRTMSHPEVRLHAHVIQDRELNEESLHENMENLACSELSRTLHCWQCSAHIWKAPTLWSSDHSQKLPRKDNPNHLSCSENRLLQIECGSTPHSMEKGQKTLML